MMYKSPTILMIRPVGFEYNPQTAVNNAFQQRPVDVANVAIQQEAANEFDRFVDKLSAYDIPVMVVEDTPHPHTPDSIFPNNWITFHQDGTIALYPMYAENRRLERKDSVLQAIRSRFYIRETVDFSIYEQQHIFLEGTGSFVLDREQKIAYACLSPRTDRALFERFCDQFGYISVVFQAYDPNGIPIYHTNVMMCIADRYAVINLESIPSEERCLVREILIQSGKCIVEITHEQMDAFAGNMLQVFNAKGQSYLVMSSQAYKSLSPQQLSVLEKLDPIIHSDLYTIERHGGGSARCMMAEIYLPLKEQNT